MRESFEIACNLTLGLEGKEKYTNDPRDPGGPTKYGIAGKYHPGVDIEHLTLEQAKEIYIKEYWIPAGCDDAPFPMDICMFDSQVNPQGGGNKELLEKKPENWQEYNIIRMIRYMKRSKPEYVKGHVFRVLNLTQSILLLLNR